MAEGQPARKTAARSTAKSTTRTKGAVREPSAKAAKQAKQTKAVKPAAPSRSRLRLVPAEGERQSKKQAAASARVSLLLLLIPTGFLIVLGLVMVLSAGSISAVEGYDGNGFWYFQRQVIYAVVGVAVLGMAWRLPYRIWQRLAAPMLLLSLPLMVIALHPTAGTEFSGASRWIDLGPVTLQPSEFLKLGMVAFAATILTRKWKRLDEPAHLLLPLAPVLVLAATLVILQKDLGTTIIICLSVFVMLFVAGVRGRYLGVAGVTGFLAGALLIFGQTYRRERFLDAWLSPMSHAQDAGYQLIQGLIALGSGGWLGVGLGNSRQKWDYLPNAHSDFIFAIIGEELGLIGAIAVVATFAVLVYAGIRIAVRAPDTFGRLLASGIVAWIGLQAIVNMGAVTGLLPITGIPLPLVSFGGTALVVTLAGIGVLASIARSGAAAGGTKGSTPRGRARPVSRRAKPKARP
jgi:cell division protein FtsW